MYPLRNQNWRIPAEMMQKNLFGSHKSSSYFILFYYLFLLYFRVITVNLTITQAKYVILKMTLTGESSIYALFILINSIGNARCKTDDKVREKGQGRLENNDRSWAGFHSSRQIEKFRFERNRWSAIGCNNIIPIIKQYTHGNSEVMCISLG